MKILNIPSWWAMLIMILSFDTVSASTNNNWDINFLNFAADMSYNAVEHFELKYEIGKGQAYETELLAADCESAIAEDISIVSPDPVRVNGTEDHDDLTLGFTITGLSNLTSSNLWNETSSRIEFCHILRLLYVPPSDGLFEPMIISEDQRQFFTAVDGNVNFTLTSDLSDGIITTYVVRATIPGSNFTMGNITLNEDTRVFEDSMLTDIDAMKSAFDRTLLKIAMDGVNQEEGQMAMNETGVMAFHTMFLNETEMVRVELKIVLEETCDNITACDVLMNTTAMHKNVTDHITAMVNNGYFTQLLRANIAEVYAAIPAAPQRKLDSMAPGEEDEKIKLNKISQEPVTINLELIDSTHQAERFLEEVCDEFVPSAEFEWAVLEFGEPIMEVVETTIDLTAGEIGSVEIQTGITSYVQACKCNGMQSFICNGGEALGPNDELIVCLWSVSTDVQVDYLESMYVTQDTRTLSVIENNQEKYSTITSREYVPLKNGVAVSTRVPSNLFNYEEEDSAVSISGSIVMKFAGGSRRELRRDLQEVGNDQVSSYRLSIDLLAPPDDVKINDSVVSANSGGVVGIKWQHIAMLGLLLSGIQYHW